MKPRRVIVTVELETDAPIAALKDNFECTEVWSGIDMWRCQVEQIQVNVVKKGAKRGKAKTTA